MEPKQKLPKEFFEPLSAKEIERLKRQFNREPSEDDPMYEFYSETGEQESDEQPGDRNNLYYAP